ncbi:MAG: hypothetical protein WA869_35340, partial [Alloacidobacterium sp.]
GQRWCGDSDSCNWRTEQLQGNPEPSASEIDVVVLARFGRQSGCSLSCELLMGPCLGLSDRKPENGLQRTEETMGDGEEG